MLSAIIIDDEQANRNVLRMLLEKHCPEVSVQAECGNADEAYREIKEKKPDLVFLDVRMPVKSGFDLLRMFDSIEFELIFVSAYDEYAISAFEFNAIDYVLKPIDYIKLIKAVSKAKERVERSVAKNSNVFHFIQTLGEKDENFQKLAVHHNDKVVLIKINELMIIESKVEYCSIQLQNGSKYSSSKELKLFDEILRPAGHFIRINRNTIVNGSFIRSYSKGEPCFIELINGNTYEISRRKKTEVIEYLKQILKS